jgi:hypothetical protein
MVLRCHSKTFQLPGIEPRRSAFAVEALARVENKIGHTLPASVREWYELENASPFSLSTATTICR